MSLWFITSFINKYSEYFGLTETEEPSSHQRQLNSKYPVVLKGLIQPWHVGLAIVCMCLTVFGCTCVSMHTFACSQTGVSRLSSISCCFHPIWLTLVPPSGHLLPVYSDWITAATRGCKSGKLLKRAVCGGPKAHRCCGEMDAADIRLCKCLYAHMKQAQLAIPLRSHFHSPLWYNKCLSLWFPHIDLCFWKIHFKNCQQSCGGSFYDANWIWAARYLHIKNSSPLPEYHPILVCKHTDSDISFSQHIMGYYGVDLLINNTLWDNGARCLWNRPLCLS